MIVSALHATALLGALCLPQDPPQNAVLRVTPPELELPVDGSAQLRAELVDAGGRPLAGRVFYFSRARRAVRVSRDGAVRALRPGTFEIVARAMLDGERGPECVVPVVVAHPTPAAVTLTAPERMFAGTTARIAADVVTGDGSPREDLAADITRTAGDAVRLEAFGELTARHPGRATLQARHGDLRTEHVIDVLPNPVADLELAADATDVRTGDVVHFSVTRRDADGAVVETAVPVQFTCTARPVDALGNGATGQIRADGRFVAEQPGLYTVVAHCGDAVARRTIRARQRFEQTRRLVEVGHGPVLDVHTSDLWVWEGVDGRDYAVTGTWGADGDAIFWDVTDPARLRRIATVRVDARTVNDVKVSADGRLCIISREGASDRKNGIVLIDVTDPREPSIISTYDDELTGGVHNLFIDGGHVFALSAARRYDVIDIRDAGAPTRVGSFQLFEPGASIHDVWVSDGIAFSSNWRHGLRLVDVGNGVAGGSPENPVEFSHYTYPSGWNHAAFPWRSPDTDRFYVVAGDEAFPYGLNVRDDPTYPRGWIHFVDFSDFDAPEEVARYQVPEAGTHNLWIEGTTLYVAYYNAGVRVVDISGELLGDLYRQGREIAWFRPTHPEGVVPNAPMTWGPQPHKGHLFVSDWNSGLWALKLVDRQRGRR